MKTFPPRTHRDQINEKLRWYPWMFPAAPLFAAFFIAALAIRLDFIWMAIAFAVPLAGWGIFAASKLGLCPQCRSRLLPLCGYHSKIHISKSLLPEKIRYCPVCGLDFDRTIADGEQSHPF